MYFPGIFPFSTTILYNILPPKIQPYNLKKLELSLLSSVVKPIDKSDFKLVPKILIKYL